MEHGGDMVDGNSEGGKLEAWDIVIGKQNEQTMLKHAFGLDVKAGSEAFHHCATD
jgi:hypothetical protein